MLTARQFLATIIDEPAYGVGDIVRIKGKPCKIVSGQYWGLHGLSNHWEWREVLEGGKLGPRQFGYGDNWKVLIRKHA